MNLEFIKFINALCEDNLSLRTFSDKNKSLKGVVQEGSTIRCNVCGKFYDEKEIYLGIKNRPICKKCSPVKLSIHKDQLPRYEALLAYKNEHHHGVHISVNGGHTDKEVTKVVAQFFEIDTKPMYEQVELVKALPLRPSIVVKTRKSLHVYYLIKDGEVRRFREIQERLAYTYGGDMQKRNLSTCMRVPGYNHHKKEPIMVKLLHCDTSLVYTQDELLDGLKLYRLPEKPKRARFDFQENKHELLQMAMYHLEEKTIYETSSKLVIECINPHHNDRNPSAVMFKDGLNFYCSGCGYSARLQEAARDQGWNDILEYIEEKKRA